MKGRLHRIRTVAIFKYAVLTVEVQTEASCWRGWEIRCDVLLHNKQWRGNCFLHMNLTHFITGPVS